MNEVQRIHMLDMKITRDFHKGIELYHQGCDKSFLPSKTDIEYQALLNGWLAAQEMDNAKKKWLTITKDLLIK